MWSLLGKSRFKVRRHIKRYPSDSSFHLITFSSDSFLKYNIRMHHQQTILLRYIQQSIGRRRHIKINKEANSGERLLDWWRFNNVNRCKRSITRPMVVHKNIQRSQRWQELTRPTAANQNKQRSHFIQLWFGRGIWWRRWFWFYCCFTYIRF